MASHVTAPQTQPAPEVRFGQVSGAHAPAPGFGRGGVVAGIAVVAVVLGGLVWSAAAGSTAKAQRPSLFGGSLVLEDDQLLSVLDVATAQVTVGLSDADSQVGAHSPSAVEAVPVDEGTFLVNRRTGTFNLLGKDNYVLDPNSGGVGLGRLDGSTSALAVGAGSSAYVLRRAAHTSVSLVDQGTVSAAAARSQSQAGTAGKRGSPTTAAVQPRGFAQLGGSVSVQSGPPVVQGSDLWALVASGGSCQVVQIQPVPAAPGLLTTVRTTFPLSCAVAAIEADQNAVTVITPGHLRTFEASGPKAGADLAVPATSGDSAFSPVTGEGSAAWFLARGAVAWTVVGADSHGRVVGPFPLVGFGAGSDPVEPALSSGRLYTLDAAATGQPALWAIDPASGSMAEVLSAYPKAGRESVGFGGTEVTVDGPRVVFNNPASHEAVVVFTDGSRGPAVVNKERAVEVSATGPADLATGPQAGGPGKAGGPRSPGRQLPAVQAVSQSVTCANTTQKPYAPLVTGVNPSSGAAVVTWSYALLNQSDCEPDSWSVKVTALSSSHQPRNPVQTVNGQEQYLFAGLRPATDYQVVVTAYINLQSTASAPVPFRTAPRGPDAPLVVKTTTDASGNWVVSWTPCLEITHPNCVVPADRWTVTGAACGSSFVGQPPSVTVSGALDTVTIPATPAGLLGDSLSFSVQGQLISGLTGDPTSDHSCTESWRPPNPSAVKLKGSGVAAGQTITATLQVAWTGSASSAFGSQATQFLYRIGGRTVGPTTATTVEVAGLAAGQEYTPSVTITPAGHPSGALTIQGAPFAQTLSWPQPPAIALTATPSVSASDPTKGTLGLTFSGLPGGKAAGPFSLDQGSALTCGSWSAPLSGRIVGASLTPAFQMTDLNDEGTNCSVTAVLTDDAQPDPYGTASDPIMSGTFDFGAQLPLTFAAAYGTPVCDSTLCLSPSYPITVSYGPDGTEQPPFGDRFAVQAKGDVVGQQVCASGVSNPTSFPVVVTVSGDCKNLTSVTVTVTWQYLGVTTTQPWTGSPSGQPPPPPSTTTTTTTTTTLPCPTTTTTGKGHAAACKAASLATRGPAPNAAGSIAPAALGWYALGLVVLGSPGLVRRVRKYRRERGPVIR